MYCFGKFFLAWFFFLQCGHGNFIYFKTYLQFVALCYGFETETTDLELL